MSTLEISVVVARLWDFLRLWLRGRPACLGEQGLQAGRREVDVPVTAQVNVVVLAKVVLVVRKVHEINEWLDSLTGI